MLSMIQTSNLDTFWQHVHVDRVDRRVDLGVYPPVGCVPHTWENVITNHWSEIRDTPPCVDNQNPCRTGIIQIDTITVRSYSIACDIIISASPDLDAIIAVESYNVTSYGDVRTLPKFQPMNIV